METIELKVQIPEGYEIDESKSTFEKIVFKKKDDKPRSWEDYCKQQIEKEEKGYFIRHDICIPSKVNWIGCTRPDTWKNVLPSEELAEAFIAMMQLMSLRQAWIGDWKPVWDGETSKPCIYFFNNKCEVDPLACIYKSLSFPTREMAEDFMNCFKDLLETAKPLI